VREVPGRVELAGGLGHRDGVGEADAGEQPEGQHDAAVHREGRLPGAGGLLGCGGVGHGGGPSVADCVAERSRISR
jgi:hypothetical protein